ncbi:enhancer of polycomb 1-like isoform 1-like protein [Camelus ferus]|nr:enhancer of polycomb 1-like isoform 1-like protein [Camelus ferus]
MCAFSGKTCCSSSSLTRVFASSPPYPIVAAHCSLSAKEHHLQRAISAQQVYGEKRDNMVIPVPEAESNIAYYESIYPGEFKMPKQLIHIQPFSLDAEQPDYDLDSEDEVFVNKLKKKMDICPLQFEEMIDRLEKGSGQQPVSLQEAKLLLKEDDELIREVYEYWIKKRKSCRGPSLIPSVKQEKRDGSSTNDPYVAFRRRTEKMQTRKNRKNDEASYEKMLKLRRDLSRAVTILEMIKRREKSKRELLHLTLEIMEKRYNLGDYSGEIVSEVLAQRQPGKPAYAAPAAPIANSAQYRHQEAVDAKEFKGSKVLSGSSEAEEENDPDGPFAFRRKAGCQYYAVHRLRAEAAGARRERSPVNQFANTSETNTSDTSFSKDLSQILVNIKSCRWRHFRPRTPSLHDSDNDELSCRKLYRSVNRTGTAPPGTQTCSTSTQSKSGGGAAHFGMFVRYEGFVSKTLDSASAQFAASALVTSEQLMGFKMKDDVVLGIGVNGVLPASGVYKGLHLGGAAPAALVHTSPSTAASALLQPASLTQTPGPHSAPSHQVTAANSAPTQDFKCCAIVCLKAGCRSKLSSFQGPVLTLRRFGPTFRPRLPMWAELTKAPVASEPSCCCCCCCGHVQGPVFVQGKSRIGKASPEQHRGQHSSDGGDVAAPEGPPPADVVRCYASSRWMQGMMECSSCVSVAAVRS